MDFSEPSPSGLQTPNIRGPAIAAAQTPPGRPIPLPRYHRRRHRPGPHKAVGFLIVPLLLGLGLVPRPCQAAKIVNPRNPCIQAAMQVERLLQIPAGLMTAIVLVESSDGVEPNPFAINRAGAAIHPRSYRAAADLLRDTEGHPARDVDVGCAQISMRYHLDRVDGRPELALAPFRNVHLGGIILAENHRLHGSWTAAVGHYNARPGPIQNRYICRVLMTYTSITRRTLDRASANWCSQWSTNVANATLR